LKREKNSKKICVLYTALVEVVLALGMVFFAHPAGVPAAVGTLVKQL
jgi:hypothetical protein